MLFACILKGQCLLVSDFQHEKLENNLIHLRDIERQTYTERRANNSYRSIKASSLNF